MPELNKQKILAGRRAVEAYRTAHTKLHEKGWHKGIHEEHTPLFRELEGKLRQIGFNSAEEFRWANLDFNAQELGFTDTAEMWALASEEEKQEFKEKWR